MLHHLELFWIVQYVVRSQQSSLVKFLLLYYFNTYLLYLIEMGELNIFLYQIFLSNRFEYVEPSSRKWFISNNHYYTELRLFYFGETLFHRWRFLDGPISSTTANLKHGNLNCLNFISTFIKGICHYLVALFFKNLLYIYCDLKLVIECFHYISSVSKIRHNTTHVLIFRHKDNINRIAKIVDYIYLTAFITWIHFLSLPGWIQESFTGSYGISTLQK